MKRISLGVVAVVVVCGGCQQSMTRLNAPPHGTTERVSKLQDMYVHMVNNALLADMAVSDVHFVPHRERLNALGEQRLCRLASLMEVYGGTIRFSTDAEDAELVEGRLASITAFLAGLGMDTSGDVVELNMRGGEGMAADEAILIKANEGTYKPSQSDSGSSVAQ